jgi:hypothetical protein
MTLGKILHLAPLAFLALFLIGPIQLVGQEATGAHAPSFTAGMDGELAGAPAVVDAAEFAPGAAEEGEHGADVVQALQPTATSVALFPTQEELAKLAAEASSGLEVPAFRQRARGSVPLMAAGATLLVAGAIIGGDAGTIVMVGGAGLLAWGAYLHF